MLHFSTEMRAAQKTKFNFVNPNIDVQYFHHIQYNYVLNGSFKRIKRSLKDKLFLNIML